MVYGEVVRPSAIGLSVDGGYEEVAFVAAIWWWRQGPHHCSRFMVEAVEGAVAGGGHGRGAREREAEGEDGQT